MAEIKIEIRGFGADSGSNPTSDDVVGVLDITSSEDFPLIVNISKF